MKLSKFISTDRQDKKSESPFKIYNINGKYYELITVPEHWYNAQSKSLERKFGIKPGRLVSLETNTEVDNINNALEVSQVMIRTPTHGPQVIE